MWQRGSSSVLASENLAGGRWVIMQLITLHEAYVVWAKWSTPVIHRPVIHIRGRFAAFAPNLPSPHGERWAWALRIGPVVMGQVSMFVEVVFQWSTTVGSPVAPERRIALPWCVSNGTYRGGQ
jgi:hypothetical protein